MTQSAETVLDPLYFYGYRGKAMVAAPAPAAMPDNAKALIGEIVAVGTARYRVLSIQRQISGPVAKGEPIGIEIEPVGPERRAGG